ncbi:uncharacterized protein [Oryctolagus cuniculus]|uniref:uncharacterized protein isoform X4 n=1 Tax=Oryctolagus cuniculus TaxID=9986 RepID=UPI00387A1B27
MNWNLLCMLKTLPKYGCNGWSCNDPNPEARSFLWVSQRPPERGRRIFRLCLCLTGALPCGAGEVPPSGHAGDGDFGEDCQQPERPAERGRRIFRLCLCRTGALPYGAGEVPPSGRAGDGDFREDCQQPED